MVERFDCRVIAINRSYGFSERPSTVYNLHHELAVYAKDDHHQSGLQQRGQKATGHRRKARSLLQRGVTQARWLRCGYLTPLLGPEGLTKPEQRGKALDQAMHLR
jgi:hypothetical protein